MNATAEAISSFYSSSDGLRLHVREHRPAHGETRWPVVCLPGLTRSTADFEILAHALAAESATPRRVIAFDYRGRGLSDHDPDPTHYDLAVERADFLLWLEAAKVDTAHFLGTSRGGLHVLALAAAGYRAMIRGVVLNDIGPVLDPAGLQRLKSYVGKPVAPQTMAEAIAILKRGPARDFHGLSEDEWRVFATTTFGDDQDDLRQRSDPQLARILDAFDPSKPLPTIWDQFDALSGAPLLTIRGASSDLLSEETLEAMTRRWPGCSSWTVPGQGHAPLLVDRSMIERIDTFLAAADEIEQRQR